MEKVVKSIIALAWCFATMLICGVDTDYTPLSNILILVVVWVTLGLVIYKIDWKNDKN